jgi:hypothetical protein
MTTRIFFALLAVSLAFAGTACRSHKKGKMSNTPVAEMEAGFKQRWVDKRSAELAASGVAADAAREQATREFKAQFEYIMSPK